MDVMLYFGPPFHEFIGKNNLQISIEGQSVLIRDVIAILFERYPEFKKALSERALLSGEVPKAIFILNQQVANLDSIVSGTVTIKILYPLCGG